MNGGGIFVWSHPDLVPPPVLAGFVAPFTGEFQLRFDGVVNGPYTVLASTNLIDWSMLGAAPEGSPSQFEFIGADALSHSSRLHRVRSP
jgi:hypothetical protein